MIKKRINKILWYGNDLNPDGSAKAPEVSTNANGTDGLNNGEIYVCNSDDDPVLFIRTDKNKIVRIGGHGSDDIKDLLDKKLDKSVWDSIFVIHKDDPENPEKITSVQSLVGLWTNSFLSAKGLNPGSGGGSGEGGATALYQLNDVAKNDSETNVLGAAPGKVLTYGTDGKWYAADAVGLDETALSKYLTDNEYTTRTWVSEQLGNYTTTTDLATLLGNKVDKVDGKGLSTNDFTDTLLDKLNSIEEGANKYILPIAKAAILGGVMIGSTLTASATGILNLPEVTTAGTYAKVTTDIYGRVTSGSSLSAGDIPALSISKITGLQDALNEKVNKSDFNTEFDKAMQRWFVRDTANKGLHPADYNSEAVGIYSDSYISAKGANPGSGGGSGGDFDRLDSWSDYDASKSEYVLSAGLGWDLNTRLSTLESQPSGLILTTSGTGNGLAGFTQSGNTVTFAKTTFLTSHQSIYGLTIQRNGTALGTYTPNSADKTINISVPTKVSELSNDSGFALKSYVDGNFPKLTEGLIPASYLPSYVDDVIEAASLSAFPKTGESGKIYVALDTNLTYRWSGTTYVEISPSLALGETSTTAYAGDKGKANATAIAALKAITISAGTGLSGGGNLTANRTLSLKVATTEALGGIKVGTRLSIDANGVLSATYTYTLPTASATVLGGVKVGTTLNIASGVLNLKAVGTAGTYFKVTTDAYGRVTSGSNPTTLSGFGITDGVNAVTVSGSGNAVTSASVSGHTLTLSKGTTFLTKATFDDLFEKVNIGTTSAPVYAIKAKYGLYTDQFISSKGLNTGTSGGGGGSDYDRLDTWTDYDASKAGWVLSAGLGNDLNTRVTSLENGAAVTVTPSGTGAVVTGVTKAGTVITVTKGNLAFGSLTNKPTTISGYGITDAYTKAQADGAYVKKSGSAMTGGIDWTAAGEGLYAIKLGVSHYIGIDGTSNSSMLHWTGGGTVLGSTKGTTTIRSNASNLSHNYNGTEYVILDARNYNSYAPTKTGTGASGTWGINVTGNAATATKLQTACTLWGQGFDGTANIGGSLVGVANVTFTGSTATYSIGSANVAAHTVFTRNIQSDSTLYLRSAPSTSIIFHVGSTEVARFLQPNGYLGLGTTSPTERLHVAGNITANILKSTIATGTAPLTVASTTVVTNLNADLLDGKHLAHVTERNYSGSSASGTKTGWFRIGETLTTDSGGCNFILFIHRNYSYLNNESYTISVNITYGGYATINQISGYSNVEITSSSPLLDKIRVTGTSLGTYYVDIHIAYSTTTNQYYWSAVGSLKTYDTWKTEADDNITTLNNTFEAKLTTGICNNIKAATNKSYFIRNYVPALSVGYHSGISFGRESSNYNNAYVGFRYAGSGSTSNGLNFGMYGAENLMFLNGLGNLGIGTITPSYKLHVVGDIYSTGNIISPTYTLNNSSTNPYLKLVHGGINWYLQAYSNTYMYLGAGTTNSLRIDNQGNTYTPGTFNAKVGIWSDGYMSAKGQNTTSDMRLKNKGRDVFLTIKDIANAPAFEYTWKDGTPGVMVGSSAQYWRGINENFAPLGPDRRHFEMMYGNLGVVLGISLARHFETLEERVKRLEKENLELREFKRKVEQRLSA